MQIKSFLSIGLVATGVLAFPQAPASGGGAAVSKALSDITTSLKGLNGKLSAWKGDVVEASTILTDAQNLLGVIQGAAKAVSGVAELPLNQAVNILQPANALIKEEQGVMDGLIKAKADFDKSQLSSVVKDILAKFKTEAGTLLGAVIKILPSNVKTVGDSIGKQINAALDKGIAAYA